MLEKKIGETFGDDEPSHFGSGWWSGVLSTFFGFLALGAVICLHFPQLLGHAGVEGRCEVAVADAVELRIVKRQRTRCGKRIARGHRGRLGRG